ncbi:hypothetical protein I4W93_016350 [Rheinheimera sp. MA13]|uniref:Uncharacterized protein n=1 Tax=Rheinheimera maricola TaxID=2793282 RepID=A0ABS7XC95_9GAMM|nr:hypothetical protein [Rheinheimera maricola]MBZ9613162.1 hypothetical protein [Rheinheimera maricola]
MNISTQQLNNNFQQHLLLLSDVTAVSRVGSCKLEAGHKTAHLSAGKKHAARNGNVMMDKGT